MIRALIICAALGGCASPSVVGYTSDGKTVPVKLIMAPACLAICTVAVTTSGSDVDTFGGNAPRSIKQSTNVITGVGN